MYCNVYRLHRDNSVIVYIHFQCHSMLCVVTLHSYLTNRVVMEVFPLINYQLFLLPHMDSTDNITLYLIITIICYCLCSSGSVIFILALGNKSLTIF